MAAQVLGQTWRFVDFSKTRPVYGSESGFLLLALAGIGLVLARERARVLRDPVHPALLVPLATITAALLLPRTPAVYQHAWLPVLPILAVYAGLALARGLDHARARGRPRRAGARRLCRQAAPRAHRARRRLPRQPLRAGRRRAPGGRGPDPRGRGLAGRPCPRRPGRQRALSTDRGSGDRGRHRRPA